MLRIRLNREQPPDPSTADAVARALSDGGVVAIPTETVYGLSVDPRNPMALERLFHAKRRPKDNPVPFVASDVSQVGGLAVLTGALAEGLAARFWPGPLTLVLPLARHHPLASWRWGGTVGIRVPGSPLIRGLAAHLGIPLPATSANLSGEAPISDPSQLSDRLAGSIDLFLDAGVLPSSLPSTVLSLIPPRPRIIRWGAVERSKLLPYLPMLEGLPSEG